jgi:hypothetical protein
MNTAKEIHKQLFGPRQIPLPITQDRINYAVAMGMTPKNKLIDGMIYRGFCLYVTYAMWNAKHQEFRFHDGERPKELPYPTKGVLVDFFVPVDRADPDNAAKYLGRH